MPLLLPTMSSRLSLVPYANPNTKKLLIDIRDQSASLAEYLRLSVHLAVNLRRLSFQPRDFVLCLPGTSILYPALLMLSWHSALSYQGILTTVIRDWRAVHYYSAFSIFDTTSIFGQSPGEMCIASYPALKPKFLFIFFDNIVEGTGQQTLLNFIRQTRHGLKVTRTTVGVLMSIFRC